MEAPSRSELQGELADGRPALDEIVEQMSHEHWWLGLEAGGKYFHLNITATDGLLRVHLSDQGDEDAEWEGDNRERPFPSHLLPPSDELPSP
jgi:hypothetical protein